MAQPCIQGERIAKVETKQDAIMERLEKVETKQDETLAAIHEIKQQLTQMCGAYVRKDEFDKQKEEIDQAKGMIKIVYWLTAGGGLAGLAAFAKAVLRIF